MNILVLIDYKDYINTYPDIKNAGIKTKQKVMQHYNRFGKRENRKIKFNIIYMTGVIDIDNYKNRFRFGNLLFFTYIVDYLARINDLPIIYEKYDEIISLGIPLFTEGITIHNETCTIKDSDIDFILENPQVNKNVYIDGYFQTPSTAKFIKNKINEHRENVMKLNPYTYENNNIFIHVRLGDIQNTLCSCPFNYYDKVLSNIIFDKGYISSDTITHPICQELVNKYNLNIFSSNEVDTIKFGSSCKHIVLSLGTFSWYIGAFSFESNVYFPETKKAWHGDIFIFPEWKEIKF
jgi:hypothetical protein